MSNPDKEEVNNDDEDNDQNMTNETHEEEKSLLQLFCPSEVARKQKLSLVIIECYQYISNESTAQPQMSFKNFLKIHMTICNSG